MLNKICYNVKNYDWKCNINLDYLSNISKIFHKIPYKCRQLGIGGFLNFSLKKVTGISDLEEQLNTLQYLFSHYVDITKFPPAEGNLRRLQLCNLAMLGILDAVCQKYNWQYWLYAGTLLGAVRHKGFIPWDDDIDVAMPRRDYDEFRKNASAIFNSYDEKVITVSGLDILQITCDKSHTGILLDIFPVDIVNAESDDESENMQTLIQKMRYYQKSFYASKRKTYQDYEKLRNKFLGMNIDGTGGGYAVHHPEFYFNNISCNLRILHTDFIFPLKKIQFEGQSYNAPCDLDKYLRMMFGNYMSFPKSGIEHHFLSENAEKSGVDMEKILVKLKDIERFFRI